MTVGQLTDAQVTVANTTTGGRPADAGTGDLTQFLMLWEVPKELAAYSKISKDDCPQCDRRKHYLVVPVYAAFAPPGHETLESATSLTTTPAPAFWGDTYGSNSLAGAGKGVAVPEEKQAELAALIARPPDLVVWNRGGFVFADGLAKAGCYVPRQDQLFAQGGNYIVMGVANGQGHVLPFKTAHKTPGSGCFSKGATESLDG